MAIEIVTFPMNSMVIFHSYVSVYQRVAPGWKPIEAMGRIIWGDKVPLFEERSILTLLSLVHVISKKVAIFVAPPFFSIAFPCDKMANHLNHNWMILDPFLVKSPNSHRFTGWNSARCWEVVERDFHHQNHWRSRPLLLKCQSGLRVREYIYIIL